MRPVTGQRGAIEAIIDAAADGLYSGGWGFPARPFNWSLYVFYGGDIREAHVPWLRDQADRMAALPAADDDGDMPAGLFVLTSERGTLTTWEIHGGTVTGRPAPGMAWLLR